MTTIRIDEMDYELEQLSDEVRAQLTSMQFVDGELVRLQAKVAAMQTARNAYANALKDLLAQHKATLN
jgi:DNA repair ATPase RecN